MVVYLRFFLIVLVFFIWCTFPPGETAIIKFTKLECKTHDESFATFQQCQLKVLGRNKIALQLHINVLQKLDDNLWMNLELFRKSHDFRPFMYNDTLNFCGFLRNPNRFMFWKVVFQDMLRFSNVNHTCPYEHDIIIRDMVLEANMMKSIPFPPNDYMIQFKALKANKVSVEIKVFIVITD